MKFFDANTKNTIRDEINRICGTTDAVYALIDKVARVDAALDDYWFLASQSVPKMEFDDTGNTSAPIETQSLVAGTQAYKISSFTNAVLQILKVSILTDDAVESDLTREEFDNIGEFAETYSTDSGDRGTPTTYTIVGDYIYLDPCPSYSETNGLRVYANREISKYTPVTFTTTHASEQINATAHGLVNGDTVILTTNNTLPTGYSADTVYYVVNKATDTFQVATAGGGSAVSISSDGTGTHKFIKISKVPGIPVIHHLYLARKAALPFLIEKKLPQTSAIAQEIAMDEQKILEYWLARDRSLRTKIITNRRVYK